MKKGWRYVRLKNTHTYHGSLEYSKSLPLVEKTMRATSASQSTEISWAFLSKPDLLFENVTCLLILFSILFNCTLPLPILYHHTNTYFQNFAAFFTLSLSRSPPPHQQHNSHTNSSHQITDRKKNDVAAQHPSISLYR